MLLGFDFESFYSTEYSLTRMDPPCYILDPQWETIGCSFKEGNAPAFFVDGPDVGKYLAGHTPEKTTTYAFNALFDNCIAAWHYGFIPVRMLCTMRLAVATRGHLLSTGQSLRSVARILKLGEKGTTIENARGMHRADLMANPGLWRAYQAYANNDNELNSDILNTLLPELPQAERRVMDRVIRCAVQPRFMVDTQMLRDHLVDLVEEKAQMLIDAGAPTTMVDPDRANKLDEFAKTLRSNTKFQEVLEAHGVEVQFKTSLTNSELQIPAFAKTDDFMAELQEHPDPDVQALAAARLGQRSTIEQTRGERLLRIAELNWQTYRDGNTRPAGGGVMPIPLKYAAAHTHRLGGDWKMNAQNLPSGRGLQKSKLRKSLKAPPGYKVVVADKSQIECRINAMICGQHDLVELFRNKGDPYSALGSHIFERPVDKKTDGGIPRFIGKGGELGLGFGCGDAKFYTMVVRQARTLGMDMKVLLQTWTPDLAFKSVRVYRTTHAPICSTWEHLKSILGTAWLGVTGPVRWGPVVIGHGYVEGPGGLKMQYANPRRDPEDGELYYDYGRRTYRMYGPKFLENIVQFLARIDTMNDALRIGDRTGIPFCMQSHDELAWIVPEADAQAHLDICLEEMRRPPSWLPGIPLDAEGGIGDSYGDAK